jgi:hypothetical protein
MTLQEILHTCADWEEFCAAKGWSVFAVNEGGGHIEQELTLEEARKFGVLPPTSGEKT